MSHDRREPKRARQACLNCRRKKARCSGEKPVCAFCARLNQTCEWDSPSSAELPSKPSSSFRRASSSTQDSGLAARVALLEAKLSLLNDEPTLSVPGAAAPSSAQTSRQQARGRLPRKREVPLDIEPPSSTTPTSSDFSTLPDQEIFLHLIDTYFEHNHNQPYAYFHEASFRRSFEENELPEYLLLAFAATACRFSNHDFFAERQLEAMTAYASSAWHRIYEDSFSYESQLEFSMVQATSMLAAIDFTCECNI